LTTSSELEDVIKSSIEAQKIWKKVKLDERISICKKFVKAFESEKDEIAKELTEQMGR
jgi:acyl-CoA reductase-like NAD-dependent aldehyde dehydrogenase